ncbi:MAG: serine hydrolase [Clostridia bacterium]|nr:serine hydrolase [Clostridia bacterium]
MLSRGYGVQKRQPDQNPHHALALEEVENGRLALDSRIPVFPCHCVVNEAPVIKDGTDVPLSVLLEHMITDSNNSATNVLIDLLGMDKVNAFSKHIGLQDTILRRHMLDYESARQGRENRTLVFAALATAPSDAQCIAFLQSLSPHVISLL